MTNKVSIIALLLTAVLTTGQAEAANFSSVYAFGDSLSDSGKSSSSVWSIYNFLNGYPGPINPNGVCDSSHPCPPYFEGRYSNGPTTVERLANSVLPNGSNANNFFNYAVSGSTTGLGNYGDGGSQSNVGAWDDFHPTAPMHALVADAMVSQVPVPAAIWLYASGLVAVFSRGNYRALKQYAAMHRALMHVS